MTALPGTRRRRTLAMFVVSVLILGAVPLLGWVGARAILDARGGKTIVTPQLPLVPFPKTPTGVLLTHDGAGRLTSVTVFVVDPSGAGGSILSVPVNADYGFTDDARVSLQQAYKKGKAADALDAIGSLLPISFDFTADYDIPTLTKLLQTIGKITVNLPQAVPATTGKSDDIPAGKATLDPAQIAHVLTSSPGDFKKEDARRPDVEAVWAAIAAAVGAGKQIPGLDATAAPASFEELANHVLGGRVQTRGLTAIALTATQNPKQIDVEQLDRSEAVFVFAAISPSEMSPTQQGSSFRLVAPPGYDARVKRTIDKLLFLGANVVSVDTTAKPQPDTVLYVPDDTAKPDADSTKQILGDFTYGTPTSRISGVDITVVLGTNFLTSAASQ